MAISFDRLTNRLPELTGNSLKVLLAITNTASKGHNKSFVTMKAREIQQICGFKHREYVHHAVENLVKNKLLIKERGSNHGNKYILLDF